MSKRSKRIMNSQKVVNRRQRFIGKTINLSVVDGQRTVRNKKKNKQSKDSRKRNRS